MRLFVEVGIKLSNLHHGRMRGEPKPLFCQTPRVKNHQSLQDSSRDSEPLTLALSQMTSYEYDMLKPLLTTSGPLINPQSYI